MSSDTIMLLFNLIILIFGFYGIFSAVHMKRTGIPSTLIVSKGEASSVAKKEEFCDHLYVPTVIFGVVSCLYGIVTLFNQYVLQQQLIKILAVVCYLIVCMWYVKELQKIKADYLL